MSCRSFLASRPRRHGVSRMEINLGRCRCDLGGGECHEKTRVWRLCLRVRKIPESVGVRVFVFNSTMTYRECCKMLFHSCATVQ
jgi:hypothetical protein